MDRSGQSEPFLVSVSDLASALILVAAQAGQQKKFKGVSATDQAEPALCHTANCRMQFQSFARRTASHCRYSYLLEVRQV
jgi:hypothetical protein